MIQTTKDTLVPGALTKPNDRLLILVGHDTKLANISGALHLSWLIYDRMNATPQAGRLSLKCGSGVVQDPIPCEHSSPHRRLTKMRTATPLTLAHPPESVSVFIPRCGQAADSMASILARYP
jgi:4-phytase / acid phosphatase